jgi:membrane protein YqaA with SNARE-associated domain
MRIFAGLRRDGRRMPFTLLRKLYDWVLAFAETPQGTWALFLLAVAESSFFPIPPDVLLMALAVAAPSRAFRFAAICSAGSVLGGVVGYLLGLKFYELLGRPIIEFYSAGDAYQRVQQLYRDWDAIAVAVAGFTPIPYKVFTIAAGVFEINFTTFLLASIVSRSARFFLISGLIWWLGPRIRAFIERYFNLLTVVFAVLLVGGFILLKYVI